MPNLTDSELRAVAYFSIGVSSEGKDVAYQLSYAGSTIHHQNGSVTLEPVQGSNSGYSIGTLQTDFGAHPEDARALVDSFQNWAQDKKNNHQDWVLNDTQKNQFTSDLARDGNHIRDPNFTADEQTYGGKKNIPSSVFPSSGPDIDPTFKSHLESYLATDAGKSFIHQRDMLQVNKLMSQVAPTIEDADFYKKASPEDQAKIFGMTAKAYNQSEHFGKEILDGIRTNKINSIDDISKKIDTFIVDKKHPERLSYMQTGRNDTLKGVEMFNTLRSAGQQNPMHDAWLAVTSDPLVDPTKLGKDPSHPNLPGQYATIKGTFVQTDQGRAFVNALENTGSYNYGDPSNSHSRGFFAEGKDFAQWDRDGNGRAFVSGQWSEFSRNDLSLARNADHTLNLNITRNGQTQSLLHVTHPTGHVHTTPDHSPAHPHGHVLREGMQGDDVRKLQTQLGELGYLPNTGTPAGKFDPATRTAVEDFQRAQSVEIDGKVGTTTQQHLDSAVRDKHISDVTAGLPPLRDFSDPTHPQNALYTTLKEGFPQGTSQELLCRATAACYMSGIKQPDDLGNVFGGNGRILFDTSSLFAQPAVLDMSQPTPSVQQTMQQVQQFDQQQALNHAQFQAQQAQINQQQGPTR
jgi:hypothetical protein